VRPGASDEAAGDFLMAAWDAGTKAGKPVTGGHFNGKLEQPSLFASALSREELERLGRGEKAGEGAAALGGTWGFALDTPTNRVRDVGRRGLHGEVLQMPARAMTGHAWSGDRLDWTADPSGHNAIHFHDDDLADAQWAPDFEFTVPDTLPSGV